MYEAAEPRGIKCNIYRLSTDQDAVKLYSVKGAWPNPVVVCKWKRDPWTALCSNVLSLRLGNIIQDTETDKIVKEKNIEKG